MSILKTSFKYLLCGMILLPQIGLSRGVEDSLKNEPPRAQTPPVGESKNLEELTKEESYRLRAANDNLELSRENLSNLMDQSSSLNHMANRPSRLFEKAKAIGHPLQTLSLIWVLAVVETYRQQANLGPLNDHQVDSKLLFEITETILNDVEIYSGMLGASASALPFGKAFKDLHSALSNKISKRFLVEFIHSGAVSFITFVGWEAGSQLWKEAIFQSQPTEDEMKTLEKIKLFNLLTFQSSKEERDLAQKILGNAFKILTLQKPVQTRDWIYNAWRLRIATGEFASLVTGMVTGGVAAGTIFPPSFFVGVLGGFVGGGLTLFIPHEYTQALTSKIRSARVGVNQMNLHVTEQALTSVGRRFRQDQLQKMPPLKYQFDGRLSQMKEALALRNKRRNDSFTALVEDIYDAKITNQESTLLYSLSTEKMIEIQEIDANARIAQTNNVRKKRSIKAKLKRDQEKVIDLVSSSSSKIQESEMDLIQFFTTLLQELDTELNTYSSLLDRSDLFFPSEAKQILLSEITYVQSLKEQWLLLGHGIMPARIKISGFSETQTEQTIQAAQRWINLFQERGFYGSCLINSLSPECPFSSIQ